MLMVDLRRTSARLTMRDVLSAGRKLVSNPIAFAAFAGGLAPQADLLLNGCWQLPASASGGFAFFRTFLHEVLPTIYDVRHLETLGGRFSLRLSGVGDFTVTALLRRVITLRGLPVDEATGLPIIDAEMRADVFLALTNELLADLSERTLKALTAANAAADANRAAHVAT